MSLVALFDSSLLRGRVIGVCNNLYLAYLFSFIIRYVMQPHLTCMQLKLTIALTSLVLLACIIKINFSK